MRGFFVVVFWLLFFSSFFKKSKPQAEQSLKELWQDEALKISKDLDWLNSNYFTFLAFL